MSEKEYLVPNGEHHPEEEHQPEVETPIAAEQVAGEGGETEAAGVEAKAEPGVEAPAAAPVEAGAEIEAVAGEGESQPIEGMAAEIPSFKEGDILEGRVVLVQEDAAYVDVNWKTDLPVPLNELSLGKISSAREAVKEGDTIKVMVIEIEEDKIVLSRRRAEEKLVWERLKTAFHEKQPVKGKVVAAVKGGLQIDLQGVPAFLPASHADLGYLPDLAVLVGQEVDLYIIEFAEARNRLVVSRKEFLAEQKEKAKKKLFGELQVGDVRTGKITRLTSFGAFVELEQGVEGLLHISEIAWERLEHPSERLQEGEEIQVKVIKVDPEAEKISLSIKQITPHPWATVAERYKEGDIVEGKVVRITSFGAFVRLEEGIDGLIHISQLGHERVEKAEDVVKVGDTVRVKVLRVDPKERRIGLSLKETTEKPRKVVEEEKEQPPAGVYLEEDAPLSSNLGAILSEKLAESSSAGIGSFVTEKPEEVKAELDEAKAELKEGKAEMEGGILDQAAIDEIVKKVAGEGAGEETAEEDKE